MASMWRGIVGPDITIVIQAYDEVAALEQKGRKSHVAEVDVRLEDARAVIVRVEKGGKIPEGMLRHLVYPGIMAAFGIVGNAVILGGQMRDIQDELKGEIKDVWGEIKDVRGDLKDVRDELEGDIQEVKVDVKDLLRRQTELELHEMAAVQKMGWSREQ
ncbi:MAG: hypothetical protein Q9211_006183 [Gyalolechia sp. 1 TL-2023]